MTYEFYKVLHIISLITLFTGISSLTLLRFAGVDVTQNSLKKSAMIFHGVGILLMLVSGFGLAAKLHYFGNLPGWVYAKIIIWLAFGASIALANRKYQWGWKLVLFFLVLVGLAATLAVTKPF